ncbi:lysozyme [Escherichia phage vB_EcoS_PHB17]|uniref:Lysozyme n=1 Tax=Escherichia phage vB_EcoS_PHB17 TaxID=2591407 RepID=A0A514DKW8_9CAUD|nr:endolysin [Escherichia phage vB_EcoS_PHB17]QDH94273.1 lysozyme [Escherichia phage vB_EcoS_PHB17]
MTIKTRITAGAFGVALALTSPLLEEIEGIKYKPYKDIAGIWTVCAGITGKDVILGKTYTQRECDQLLQKHIKIAKDEVDKRVKVDIPDTMRAALYSFTYNAGTGAFRKSTMLKLINQGRLYEACDQLWNWTYFTNPKTGRKEKSKGLQNRRAVEFKYCVKDLKR